MPHNDLGAARLTSLPASNRTLSAPPHASLASHCLRLIATVVLTTATLLIGAATRADEAFDVVATGLKNPESVAVGLDGRIYVTEIGEMNRDGDGRVAVVVDGRPRAFATGLDDPKGLVAYKDLLFATDKDRVVQIDAEGRVTTLAGPEAFPQPPRFLNDIEVDEQGNLYVSDSGGRGSSGAVFRITPRGEVTLVHGGDDVSIRSPNGILNDGLSFMLVADMATGTLYSLAVADGKAEVVAKDLGISDGVARDLHGRVYVTDWLGGKLYVISRSGDEPRLLHSGMQGPADLCLDVDGHSLLIPEMRSGRLLRIAATAPGDEVDERPLAVATEPAFAGMCWHGWQPESDDGRVVELRPIVLTHAGDGSGRTFLATQRGVIHVFPKDGSAAETEVFLDLSDRVTYDDRMNEEGLLGLAFHPRYGESGELFVYYTSSRAEPHTSVVSRFRVSAEDPNRADPDSEEEIWRLRQPYWNHNGGTICFGPDGYLYIALGDGGLAGDPHGNGQNLATWLGSVLRIDVDRREGDKEYAIPSDNPFVDHADARPEIWAYGLRNVWRLAFDEASGTCWAADVGQNLWEEINLLVSGGNYGWNLREARHPFGRNGTGPRPDLVDPIWEYPHSIGKSITGGEVYRGSALPELQGAYIYGDYVSGRIWALWYDATQQRVVANRPIQDRALPILSFGSDEDGEIYLLTTSNTGQGIYRFDTAESSAAAATAGQ